MMIETPWGKWTLDEEDENGKKKQRWKEQTQNGDNTKEMLHFLVRYASTTGKACFGSGKTVKVTHSGGGTATFDRKDKKWSRVDEYGDFKIKSEREENIIWDEHNHPDAHITEVKGDDATCAIDSADDLEIICISAKLPMKCLK